MDNIVGQLFEYVPHFNKEVTVGYDNPFFIGLTLFYIFLNKHPKVVISVKSAEYFGSIKPHIGEEWEKEGGEITPQIFKQQLGYKCFVEIGSNEAVRIGSIGHRSYKNLPQAKPDDLRKFDLQTLNDPSMYHSKLGDTFVGGNIILECALQKFFKPYILMQSGNDEQDLDIIVNRF